MTKATVYFVPLDVVVIGVIIVLLVVGKLRKIRKGRSLVARL